MLQIEGRLLGPIVGTIFEPGTTMTNGIKINEVLDRACQEAHAVNVSGFRK
jgi:exosome complex RNA-binding protein Rrp42 (RNase PH superfamily)